jgi:uncharacterized lipoprotein YajG
MNKTLLKIFMFSKSEVCMKKIVLLLVVIFILGGCATAQQGTKVKVKDHGGGQEYKVQKEVLRF